MLIFLDWKVSTMYDVLAKHYDSLVKDEDATKAYVDFTTANTNGKKTLELACGSGEISLALAKVGFDMLATDISQQMLEVAKEKDEEHLVDYKWMDMTDIDSEDTFDNVLCYCDSMNYLEDSQLSDMFHSVYAHLNEDGVFLFDMHTLDRLDEFADEFYEAGIVDGIEFVWNIQSEDTSLYHSFIFYNEQGVPSYEHHVQNVFDPKQVKQLLEETGFKVSIYTDFDKEGIQSGEKHFFVCRKEQK